MGAGDRIFGAGRLVVYLPAATLALEDLDGSREQAIRRKAKKFLKSPESAFDKHPRDYIGHIRDLDTKTRAFATWCQNEDIQVEICLVHDIYRKENERDYWIDVDAYNNEGEGFDEEFQKLSKGEFDSWVQEKTNDDSVVVVRD
jgi:hypothetical protein